MTDTPRMCGYCLPSGARYVDFERGVCPGCGVVTELAADGRRHSPVVIPAPRAVPPASGWARWRRVVA